jgi:hypothetical protein
MTRAVGSPRSPYVYRPAITSRLIAQMKADSSRACTCRPMPARFFKKLPVSSTMTACGPSRRWRSPELAAGCWGGPAATAASGPHGATYAQDPRTAAERGPRAPVAAPTGSAAPSGGPGWSVQRDGEGGVVAGSAVILAPTSSPQVAPPSIECLESKGSRRQTPPRPQSSRWHRRCVFSGRGAGSNP